MLFRQLKLNATECLEIGLEKEKGKKKSMKIGDGVGVNNVTALKRMWRTKQVQVLSVTLQLHSKIQTIMDDCL